MLVSIWVAAWIRPKVGAKLHVSDEPVYTHNDCEIEE